MIWNYPSNLQSILNSKAQLFYVNMLAICTANSKCFTLKCILLLQRVSAATYSDIYHHQAQKKGNSSFPNEAYELQEMLLSPSADCQKFNDDYSLEKVSYCQLVVVGQLVLIWSNLFILSIIIK